MSHVSNETAASYITATIAQDADKVRKSEDRAIAKAMRILEKRLKVTGEPLTSNTMAENLCKLWLSEEQSERFGIIYLDNQHRVIGKEVAFKGTINGAAVYPREIVRSVLAHNAAAVILTHNHPSGLAAPSEADKLVTGKIKDALGTIDVRVLDHIIVGGALDAFGDIDTYSFASKGMI